MSSSLMWIFTSAACTVAANLLMRTGVRNAGGFNLMGNALATQVRSLMLEPLFLLGVLLYGLASLFWFAVLSARDLSSSYPLLVSLTFIFVTFGAVLFFQEHLSVQKLFGIAIILGGIVLVARS